MGFERLSELDQGRDFKKANLTVENHLIDSKNLLKSIENVQKCLKVFQLLLLFNLMKIGYLRLIQFSKHSPKKLTKLFSNQLKLSSQLNDHFLIIIQAFSQIPFQYNWHIHIKSYYPAMNANCQFRKNRTNFQVNPIKVFQLTSSFSRQKQARKQRKKLQ